MDAMGTPVTTASTMKLVAGEPCLDFVNTVGGRNDAEDAAARVRGDKLGSYADLVSFAAHAGLVTPALARELQRRASREPRAATAVLRRARAFREALYRALRALMLGRSPAPSVQRRTVDADTHTPEKRCRTASAAFPNGNSVNGDDRAEEASLARVRAARLSLLSLLSPTPVTRRIRLAGASVRQAV